MQALATRLNNKQGRRVRRRPHPLTQFKQCEGITSEEVCYQKVGYVSHNYRTNYCYCYYYYVIYNYISIS